MGFLTPKFTPSELTCKEAPRGQLPANATNGQVADRVVDIDEAGEDCRQRLDHVKTKIEVYKEVADEINAGKKPKKK